MEPDIGMIINESAINILSKLFVRRKLEYGVASWYCGTLGQIFVMEKGKKSIIFTFEIKAVETITSFFFKKKHCRNDQIITKRIFSLILLSFWLLFAFRSKRCLFWKFFDFFIHLKIM